MKKVLFFPKELWIIGLLLTINSIAFGQNTGWLSPTANPYNNSVDAKLISLPSMYRFSVHSFKPEVL